jgi:hypothetical protein
MIQQGGGISPPASLSNIGDEVFTVTKRLPASYPSFDPRQEHVCTIAGRGETPRMHDVLVIEGKRYNVTDVERNYDTHTVTVYVNEIQECPF